MLYGRLWQSATECLFCLVPLPWLLLLLVLPGADGLTAAPSEGDPTASPSLVLLQRARDDYRRSIWIHPCDEHWKNKCTIKNCGYHSLLHNNCALCPACDTYVEPLESFTTAPTTTTTTTTTTATTTTTTTTTTSTTTTFFFLRQCGERCNGGSDCHHYPLSCGGCETCPEKVDDTEQCHGVCDRHTDCLRYQRICRDCVFCIEEHEGAAPTSNLDCIADLCDRASDKANYPNICGGCADDWHKDINIEEFWAGDPE